MKNQVNEKTDITMHSDEELSLLVFNTEPLYKLRRHSEALIHDTLSEMFIFTSEQFDTLMQDIDDDLNEDKISRKTVAKAMRGVENPREWLNCEAVEKQLATSLELYKDRKEFDGTLESAVECLERAGYEIQGA